MGGQQRVAGGVRAGSADRQTDCPTTLLRRWEQPWEELFAFSEPQGKSVGGGGCFAVVCCCFNQLKDGSETVAAKMFG